MKRLVSFFVVIFVLGMSPAAHSFERCYGLYTGDNVSESDIADSSSLYGEAPCVIMLFYDSTWHPSTEQLNVIGSSGAVPVITIEPWDAKTRQASELGDKYIEGLAASFNEYGKEVYIRYAHEMNGNWYPWAGNPEKYREEYKHFYSALSQKLTNANVKWIFSVNNRNMPDVAANRAELYYPGDGYVDVIGLDGYLNEPPWFLRLCLRFEGTFAYLFGDQIESLKHFNKPFIISELGVSSDDDFKAFAIKSIFKELCEEYAFVSKIIWFNIKKEADWRINSGIQSLEFFKNGLKKWRNCEEKGIVQADSNGQ